MPFLSPLSKVVGKNKELIERLFGNIENVQVKQSYLELQQELDAKEEVRNMYEKFQNMTSTLRNVEVDENEYYNTTESLNTTDPKFAETEAYKKYSEYLQATTDETTGQPKGPQEDFNTFLSQNPAYQEDLKKSGLVKQDRVLKSEEERKQILYSKAGLTPDDIQFFETYKTANEKSHNRDLSRLVTDNIDKLTSRGSYGTKYAKMFSDRASGLQIDEKDNKPKYEFKIDEKRGKIIFVDPTNINNTKVFPYGTPEGTDKGFLNKIGYRIVEKDGKYVYEVPTDDGWKETGLDATNEQYDAWITGLEDKGLSYEDKKQLNVEYGRNSSSSRRKRNRGGNNTAWTNEDTDNYSALKSYYKLRKDYGDNMKSADKRKVAELQEDLKKRFPGKTIEEIDDLATKVYKNKDKDAKKLYKGFTGQNMDDSNSPEGNTDNSGNLHNTVKDIYKTAKTSDQKQAASNISNFINQVLTDWKRSDLTAEQWRDEIAQEEWDDLEWGILQQKFKELTGQNL